MVRWMAWLTVSGGLWLTMAGPVYGQAAVEAGLGAARAATTTAPAAGIGKAISGLAGGFDKAVKGGQPEAEIRPASTAATTVRPALGVADPDAAGPKWEDPNGIQTGMSYSELVRRFGPPSLEITIETGRTLTYSGKTGAFHVAVEDDRVSSVRKPPVRQN